MADAGGAARAFLARHLPVTRLVPAPTLSARAGQPVFLKIESELPTGSFKPRGALWALWRRMQRGTVTGVVAASTGNHGAAVAWAARTLGVPATVFLPENPNPVKRDRIASLGAAIRTDGARDLAEAARAARDFAADTGACLLDDATDPEVPPGPAVIGAEILEQAPDTGTVVVPVGDTALIRGIAAAVKRVAQDLRVIGVQAAQAPAYQRSWKAGSPIGTDTCDTIADGLATRTPVAANVEAICALVDDMVLVSERSMLRAIRHLLLEEHVVAEPAGAAATAAVLDGLELTGPAVVIVSGANISPDVLRAAVTLADAPEVIGRV